MIQVTYTKRNLVTLVEPVTIAIDPEKVVSCKDVGGVAVIEYAETHDRQRQPIVYTLTTTSAALLPLIMGNWNTVITPYITVTEYNLATAESQLVYIQEKYIVDIRETEMPLANLGVFPFLRIEYCPGAFVPEVIYAANTMDEVIVTALPTTTAEATTTEATTTAATTTAAATTTEEPTTTVAATTTIEPTTTAG